VTATLELERSREALGLHAALARAVQRSSRSLSALDTMLIQSSSPADAAAQLASIVGATADDARVQVGALQIKYDTTAKNALVSASVRLSATSDIRGLAAVLSGIESGAPLVVVRELSVTQSDPSITDDRPEQLHFELTVESLARISTAKPDSGLKSARQ
jgi:hypothetical protein